jgi:hypothetical protein
MVGIVLGPWARHYAGGSKRIVARGCPTGGFTSRGKECRISDDSALRPHDIVRSWMLTYADVDGLLRR